MITLAIETSCDDTSVAILDDQRVLINLVSSQLVDRKFTGIVPELAARSHQANIVPVVTAALGKAKIKKNEIDLVAATQGPGLIGSLLVGLHFARSFAFALERPFVGVNHIESHMLAAFLEHAGWEWPFLALVVSGGHTLLIESQSLKDHRILGRTVDDAAGECFDKVARILGLMPGDGTVMGGPIIDRMARNGDAARYRFPRPMLGDGTFDFSFSGLKTSVQNFLVREKTGQDTMPDVCAGFQEAVVDVLCRKSMDACMQRGIRRLVVCGGVASNRRLRERLETACQDMGVLLAVPSPQYCTDNAAMVGLTGWMHYKTESPSRAAAKPFASLEGWN
jgi:N6-L-threonylcarbamoyladenine synthase